MGPRLRISTKAQQRSAGEEGNQTQRITQGGKVRKSKAEPPSGWEFSMGESDISTPTNDVSGFEHGSTLNAAYP
eukprot:751489-Hanusia_phi.AAC.1